MKLRNKKTGEIKDAGEVLDMKEDDGVLYKYYSLAELNDEWEDYEEPEGWWFIDRAYEPHATNSTLRNLDADEEIGNYFETKEEAERAVEKLKAWKRLKDKGFRFDGWTIDDGLRISICTNTDSDGIYDDDKKEMKKDLDACFGGEE